MLRFILLSTLACFIFFIGCSASRPLFLISKVQNQDSKSYHHIIEDDRLKVNLSGTFDHKKRAGFLIEMLNKTNSAFLISFDRENIWLKSGCGEKVNLSEIYEVDAGFNFKNFILYSDSIRHIRISFEDSRCYRYKVSEEKLVFSINLDGIIIQERTGEKIDLLDELMIFARI